MNLWRAHIRPEGTEGVDRKDPYEFCLANSLIGIGWRVNDPDDPALASAGFSERKLGFDKFEDYLERAVKVYRSAPSSVVALAQEMKPDDLIWIRSLSGIYHLCRVTEKSCWNYNGDEIHRNLDVVNTRNVEIMEVGTEDSVPGKVVNCFIRGRAIQRILDGTAAAYSSYVWAIKHGKEVPETPDDSNIFHLLSAVECEDLVATYLQISGWIIYPSPVKRNMIAYEYVVRNKQAPFETATVQVKTGDAVINISDLPGRSFAFQTSGLYEGDNGRCKKISRDDMVSFMKKHKDILPARIQNFMNWIGMNNLH